MIVYSLTELNCYSNDFSHDLIGQFTNLDDAKKTAKQIVENLYDDQPVSIVYNPSGTAIDIVTRDGKVYTKFIIDEMV